MGFRSETRLALVVTLAGSVLQSDEHCLTPTKSRRRLPDGAPGAGRFMPSAGMNAATS